MKELAHHADDREKRLGTDPKHHEEDALAARLVEELHGELPGKRTLVELLDASADAGSARSALVPGRQTLVREHLGRDTPKTSPTGVALDGSVLGELQGRGLRDVLAALASLGGQRGLMQATLSAASRVRRSGMISQTGRPAPPDPSGQAMWRVAERRAATLYRRATDGDSRPDDPVVEEALRRIGAGQRLSLAVRRTMEREFGVALDRVRVHTDSAANAAARAVRAAAFTVGEDIFFAEGAFAPDTEHGVKLLAHELTHVVQSWQRRTAPDSDVLRVSQPSDHLEREADGVAERIGTVRSDTPNHPDIAPDLDEVTVHDAAAAGVAGTGGMLPYLEQVQRSFGPVHDLAAIDAHVGADAVSAAARIGARAYATGTRIAFGETPDLHTAAHEAAHVVQQRGGIQLASGVGAPGDVYEREADAVADRVVRGESAAEMLAQYRPSSSSGSSRVQRASPTSASSKPETQADDVLAKQPPAVVAAWYSRLADNTEVQGAGLSALLLRHWLKNRDPQAKIRIAAHPNIVGSTPVSSGLVRHRQIYLTKEKASFQGGSERFAGVIPRLQSKKWDGASPLSLEYQGLATSGNAALAFAKYGAGLMSASDADVFTSLHDFQLRTEVILTGSPAPEEHLQIIFTSFFAQILDRYDWDPNKHLTMPNPDFQSKRSDAVEPTLQRIVVYHTNAKRIEAAGLAAPYDLVTDRWPVTDQAVIGPEIIDPKKRL